MTAKEALKEIFNGMYNKQGFIKEFEVIEQALTELERLKKFKETFDNYELSKRQDFIAFENWLECERELLVIKCDVKRYFELYEQGAFNSQEEHNEFSLLYSKLLEVCAEEEE